MRNRREGIGCATVTCVELGDRSCGTSDSGVYLSIVLFGVATLVNLSSKCFSNDIKLSLCVMYRLFALAGISTLVLGSAIQKPLHESDHQAPLISHSKELVSSTALEAQITKENLLKRAKTLFKIAEHGIEEYNHPTRVIGSKGKFPIPTDSSVN